MKRNKETEQKKQAAGNYPDFEVRTDLAVEEQERFPGDGGEISGVSMPEQDSGCGGTAESHVHGSGDLPCLRNQYGRHDTPL